MMLKAVIKALIPSKLKSELRERLGVPGQVAAFKRIRDLGFKPLTCIDIGAYNGGWTTEFKSIFPECAVLMIEGQSEKKAILEKVKIQLNDVDYRIALLGADDSTVNFNIYDTASSVLSENNTTNAKVEQRQLARLDDLVKGSIFEKPDFIKIDTQGFELEILKGGEITLQAAKFVLLEVSFIDIYKDCPLVADTLQFMNDRGFVVYDICSLMRRPLDQSLFQSDFLFVKNASAFRTDKRWS
jgi:FkbM family methyltransferase